MGLALKSLFFPSPAKAQAQVLYVALVTHARAGFLYEGYHIPDTLDGRFDAIVLHLFLVSHRLSAEPDARTQALPRLLSEAFIADMDRSMREMGVGDTGVGKRIKQMASALLGRARAYEAAVHDEALLTQALARNVYREAPQAQEHAQRLAHYTQACVRALAQQHAAEIAAGNIHFVS